MVRRESSSIGAALTSLTIFLFVVLAASMEVEAATGITGVQVNPPAPQLNTSTTITIAGSPPCGGLQIDFGDGEKKDMVRVAFPVTVPHTFQKAGTFTVTAKGTSGCAGQASAVVTVKPPTSAPAPARATPFQPKTINLTTPLTATGRRFPPKTISVTTALTATGTRFPPKTINVTTILTATGTRFQPKTINISTPLAATGTRFQPKTINVTTPLTATGTRK